MLDGFKKFILRGNVVDMAVGVVIGAAFATVIGGFTKDLLTPLIGAIVGKTGDFATFSFNVRGQVFNIGDLINQIISFLLVAAAVYFFVVTPVNALMARMHKDRFINVQPFSRDEVQAPHSLFRLVETMMTLRSA